MRIRYGFEIKVRRDYDSGAEITSTIHTEESIQAQQAILIRVMDRLGDPKLQFEFLNTPEQADVLRLAVTTDTSPEAVFTAFRMAGHEGRLTAQLLFVTQLDRAIRDDLPVREAIGVRADRNSVCR